MKDTTASGWFWRWWGVFKKELIDHTRDRRSIMLALIYPMLGPLLVGGAMYFAGKTLQGDFREKFIEVPVAGLEFAPGLKTYMESQNVRFKPVTASRELQEKHVREGRLPVVLVIPKAAQGQEHFDVEFITNTGRVDNLKVTIRLGNIIRGYNRKQAETIALAAGLDAGYASSVEIIRTNVARDANVAVFFYNMMPPLMIFMIFLGGVHLAIDTTVGERERGSLEPLLLAPVERWVLLLAKSGAAFVFTAVTALVNVVAFRLFMGWAVMSSDKLVPPPDWLVFIELFVIAAPLMLIAVALQMSIAVITRSMKEAQIYLGLLPLVPALPGMVMVFSPVDPSAVTSLVPILGQMLLLTQLVSGQELDALQVLSATASTTLSAGLIFLLAAKWFRREKMFVLG
ncbi:ABC transporter permease subunit [Magnetovibrio sp. PR-2]|uniref:ABC transporter permease n=1 Tax=Magnetovibrio sp. PR-2 TaxID=3120356 RepID=UPI002FCE2999